MHTHTHIYAPNKNDPRQIKQNSQNYRGKQKSTITAEDITSFSQKLIKIVPPKINKDIKYLNTINLIYQRFIEHYIQ